MFANFNISSVTKLLSLISTIRFGRSVTSSRSSVALRNLSNSTRMAACQEISEYFEVAKKLAIEAGEVFKCAIVSEKTINTKIDQSFVTETDKTIEKMLVSGLSAKFPDHKFLAEESSEEGGPLPELTDTPTWFIDPIDGTTNFIHAFPQCCISIGLTVCKRLELGIIYNPTNNEMYTAIRGQGAFLNGNLIKTSKETKLNKSLVCIELAMLGVASTPRDIVIGRFVAMSNAAVGLRCIGSAALALAYVACGTLDAFQLEKLHPWDVAAGTIIVEEAGGVVLDTKGGPFDIMKAQTLAAATETLSKEISKLIIDTDLQTQRKRLKRIPSSSKLI